jgi:hypothetical protein
LLSVLFQHSSTALSHFYNLDCSHIGVVEIPLQVISTSGASSTCITTISVTDNMAPNINCVATPVTVEVGSSPVELPVSAIESGIEFDACGYIANKYLSKSTYTCADIGSHVVTLFAEDNSGNIGICNAAVNVVEKEEPLAVVCPSDISAIADAADCTAVIAEGLTLNSFSGPCSANLAYEIEFAPFTGEAPPSVSGAGMLGSYNFPAGVSTVHYTLTHNSSVAECSFTVTVTGTGAVDNTPPVAVCKDVVVHLNTAGSVSISPQDLDDGSIDDCSGIASYSGSFTDCSSGLCGDILLPAPVGCAKIGVYPASLRVTDFGGNTAYCTATITIVNGCACASGNVVYVKHNATGAGNGRNWANAFPYLQDALAFAAECPDIDQVWVAAGTYYPDEGAGQTNNDRTSSFRMLNGVAVYGGFNGTETGLSQRDWTANVTILSGDLLKNDGTGFEGNSDNAYHVVQAVSNGINGSAILDGFTIRGGNANGSSSNGHGGGMFIQSASPTIRNCNFYWNNAFHNGGGIYNSLSNPVLSNCRFSHNSAFDGGGLWISSASPTIIGCSLTENTAIRLGGGIFLNDGSPSLSVCRFAGNYGAFRGGGMYNYASSPMLDNCVFTGNKAESSGGGGMHNAGASPSLYNCSFSGNSATTGGAIRNIDASFPTIVNCVFWGNSTEVTDQDGSAAAMSYSIQQGGYPGVGNLDTDPLFLSQPDHAIAPTVGGDLRLQECSPAIDAGTSAVASGDDFDGNPRPANAGYDMGAFEYQAPQPLITCYADTDGDGYGDAAVSQIFCLTCGEGFVADNTDCDDADPAVRPGATEICDGVDNNCDGQIDENEVCCPPGSIVYVDQNASGANDGSSWANAFNYLQDALALAPTCSGVTQIWVAAGTYYPDEGAGQTDDDRNSRFVMLPGVAIYGGFNGTETMLSQRNREANLTVLSGDLTQNDGPGFAGNGENAYQVVRALGAGITASSVLDGFVVTAGNADGPTGMDMRSRGGGMYIAEGAQPTVANCIFADNAATWGGGMSIMDNALPTLANCQFTGNNVATRGGGLECTTAVTLSDCVFSDNSAGANGGGMWLSSAAPTLIRCTVVENTASGLGGGIYLQGGSAQMNACRIAGNYSNFRGGGMYNDAAAPVLRNCVFTGNYAPNSGGGGMYNSASSPDIAYCSFSGNSSDTGGAIRNVNASFPIINNSIFWGNNTEVTDQAGSEAAMANSIIQGGYPGSGNLDVDPLFVSQPPVGQGTSGDLRLQECSPAIDAGTSAGASDDDFDDNPRPANAGYDMGAYEFQGFRPAPVAVCQNHAVELDADGVAGMDAGLLDNGSSGCEPLIVSVNGFTTLNFSCDDVGSSIYTLVVTDAFGITATCSATVTVVDNILPTALCQNATVYLDASGNASVTAAQVNNGSFDNCDSPGLSVSPSAFTCADIGPNTVTLTVTDVNGLQSTCTATVTVAPKTTVSSISVSPNTRQYSDEVTFTATITGGASCSPQWQAAQSATFYVGTQEMGSAGFEIVGDDLVAELEEVCLLENVAGQMAPEEKSVTAVFSGIDNVHFSVGPPALVSLQITRENATLAYNGQEYFSTPSPSNCTGTVTLSAYVGDSNDPDEGCRGDIRHARITFSNEGVPGATLGAANLPVGLINPNNIHEGIAVTDFTHTLTGSNCSGGGETFEVWIRANNYYTGETGEDEVTLVTLALPGNDFVTGGGHMVLSNSAGSYAGTTGSKMNFGFNMKWNPGGNNLQGKINIIFRKLVNGQWRTYQIKSNKINSMSVNESDPDYRKAIISTKATLQDITDQNSPISLGGNLNLSMNAWEHKTANNGSLDQISVSLSGNGSQGLLFASHWEGTSAAMQIINGGRIKVRSGGSQPLAGSPDLPQETESEGHAAISDAETGHAGSSLRISSRPNPFSDQAEIIVETEETLRAVLRVFDSIGRPVAKLHNGMLDAGRHQFIFDASNLPAGFYYYTLAAGGVVKTGKMLHTK